MSLDNLIEYNNNHAKTSEDLWQYHENDPNANMAHSETFKLKARITGKTPVAGNTKDIKIVMPLKYLNKFWRILQVPLMNYEILKLTWSENYCHHSKLLSFEDNAVRTGHTKYFFPRGRNKRL